MTDKEIRRMKDGVIRIFERFNILDHAATIGSLRDDILRLIGSMQERPGLKFNVGDKVRNNKIAGLPICTIESIDDTTYYCDYTNFDIIVQDKWELVVEPKDCMYSKDNYTDEDRKVLCEDCKEKCAYAIAGVISTNAKIKKEPVSENLEQAIDTYLATYFGGEKEKQDWPFLKKIAIHFANWQKKKDDYAIEIAHMAGEEEGKNIMKRQMMAKAVDAVVKVDAGGYPYIPQMELYDYDKDIPLAKEGDKYKVILIKEY